MIYSLENFPIAKSFLKTSAGDIKLVIFDESLDAITKNEYLKTIVAFEDSENLASLPNSSIEQRMQFINQIFSSFDVPSCFFMNSYNHIVTMALGASSLAKATSYVSGSYLIKEFAMDFMENPNYYIGESFDIVPNENNILLANAFHTIDIYKGRGLAPTLLEVTLSQAEKRNYSYVIYGQSIDPFDPTGKVLDKLGFIKAGLDPKWTRHNDISSMVYRIKKL